MYYKTKEYIFATTDFSLKEIDTISDLYDPTCGSSFFYLAQKISLPLAWLRNKRKLGMEYALRSTFVFVCALYHWCIRENNACISLMY